MKPLSQVINYLCLINHIVFSKNFSNLEKKFGLAFYNPLIWLVQRLLIFFIDIVVQLSLFLVYEKRV